MFLDFLHRTYVHTVGGKKDSTLHRAYGVKLPLLRAVHSEQNCNCFAACRASHTKFYAYVASCKIQYKYAKMSFSTIKIVKIGKKHM